MESVQKPQGSFLTKVTLNFVIHCIKIYFSGTRLEICFIANITYNFIWKFSRVFTSLISDKSQNGTEFLFCFNAIDDNNGGSNLLKAATNHWITK